MEETNVLSGKPIKKILDNSVGEYIFNKLKLHAHRVIAVDGSSGQEWTAFDILAQSVRLARWMESFNLTDCVVSICSENRIEFIFAMYASIFTGCTIAPCSALYNEADFQHAFKISKPKVIFCSDNTASKILNMNDPDVKNSQIILFDNMHSQNKNVVCLKDIVQIHNNYDIYKFKLHVDNDVTNKVVFVMMSSGTSGLFKGVMLTHSNILNCISVMSLHFLMEEQIQNSVYIAVSPFTHVMGLSPLFNISGSKYIIMNKFDINKYLHYIEQYKVTSMVAAPSMLHFLLQNPLVNKYNLSSLKLINIGSAPLNADMHKKTHERFPGVRVIQSYGMTESTLVCLSCPVDLSPKFGSVGKIVNGMKVKVIDEKGNTLGPNQKGELCFKGNLIMKGYINNKQETETTIDQNQWLHSGDVGYYDEEGWFFIIDRLKELIKYKGYQVSPTEIESVLLSHSDVIDAAVVGVPNKMFGELPMAFVVRKPNVLISEKKLQDFVNEKVAYTKRLRGGIRFIAEIPRNANKKILRRVLKKMLHVQASL